MKKITWTLHPRLDGPVWLACVDFGVFDKGREVGVRLRCWPGSLYGRAAAAQLLSTRDGEPIPGARPATLHSSIEGAQISLAKRCEQARRRAMKKYK